MFIRGDHPEAVIWHRLRPTIDGFVFGRRGAWFEAQLMPNADRTLDLLLAMLEHFPPAVRVHLDDWRSNRQWEDVELATLDVRDAVARARAGLSTFAGVELSVMSEDEQLTLSGNLELFVHAATDRWLYLLQGKGLRRLPSLRPRSWRLARHEFAASDASEAAVRLIVDRLQLHERPGRAPSSPP